MRLSQPHRPVLALLLLMALCCAAAAAPAHASPVPVPAWHLDLRQLPAAGVPRHRSGVPSTAPSSQSLAGAVRQATGVSASLLTAENVCPVPAPGYAACASQKLVLRSTHRLVHPHVTPRATFTQVFPTRSARSARGTPAAAAPAAGTSSGPAAPPTAGTPAYLQQAYDLTYLSQTAGGSDTIAVVDAGNDPNAASDLATYRSTYGLPACTAGNGCFQQVNQNGTTSPLPPSAGSDWEAEISLDLDAVSALCPQCHIMLVEANSSSGSDLDAGIAAAQGLGANQISNSWAAASSSPVGVSSFPGSTVIAATGDHGYLGGGTDAYPAAFPGVTAAGGTTLSGATDGSLRGYSEAAWSLNSSGQGWGGSSGCDLAEPKPAYQPDTGCVGRSYADVSADANPDTGLRVYDSGAGGWFVEGGTSLASPLIAAYEALTGVNGTTPQWAYTDAGLLNDPTTGSSGNCAQSISYICTAGLGYDGPTGVGSISGAVVSGAPGIGGPAIGDGTTNSYTQTVSTNTAALAGGVYPNGLDTTYYWQYGTTTAYGQQTTAADLGAGTAPANAPATLSGLTPGVTYHYRLVAHNSLGTTYGYDYTLTTASLANVAPVNSVAPAIAGSALQGQTLTASTGNWSPTPTSYAYQWQRSSDGGTTWSDIAGATGSTYAVPAGDLGDDIQVIVTATNSYGTGAATSATVGPVASGAPSVSSGPTASGHADQGQVLSAISTWSPSGTSYAYQWQRSTDGGTTWSDIAGATASTYALTGADLGAQVRVQMTAVNGYGNSVVTSAPVGPVQNNAPINTSVPTVSGTTQRTHTLTATGGAWSGVGNQLSYQWQRSVDGTTWTSISGATASTYNLAVPDEGDDVRALVTATNAYGVTSAPSAPTQIIAPYPPANTAPPTVTGTAQRGVILNATQGAWTGPDNVYSYQWQHDAGEGYVNISGATGSAYTLGPADEGTTVRVVVTATDPDAAISEASAPTATVASAIPANTVAPTITGTVQRGSTLAANVGTWSGVGNGYSYQWQRSSDGSTWTAIGGATQQTYVVGLADEHNALRVMVNVVNLDGSAEAPSAATATVPTSPPVSTVAPTFNGTAQRGLTLSGITGTWSGVGNGYAYQWQRSTDGTTWTNIAGATGQAYTLTVADEGAYVRLSITATNPDGSATAASTPSALVVAAPASNTIAPAVTGTPQRSQNLTATVGTWSGVGNSYTCQWQRSPDGTTWVNISGATGFSYSVTVADEGDQLRALITAHNADGAVATPSAATVAAVGAPPVNMTTPTIAGATLRGATLTSTQGAWGGLGNAYGYQWQRSADGTTWTNITGATAYGYTLTVADEGDSVRLLVTATNPDGTVSAPSAVTNTVTAASPGNTAPPALSGAPVRGLPIASTLGTWNGNGNSYSFQWQRSADGTTWTSIAGATNSSYAPVVADEGDVVRIVVTATNDDGTVSAVSAASNTVAASAPVNTVVPTITGAPQRGTVLTSSVGTWLGVANAYAYQWQSSPDGSAWTDIGGATTGTYALGVADEGKQIRLLITATNLDGSVSAPSLPTAVIPVARPVNTVAPTISGTAGRGFLLSATPGTWGGIGNSLAYQWQSSTDGTTWTDIAGANQTTYALGIGDEGTRVRVLVTASNPDGTVSAPSAASAIVASAPPVNTVAPTTLGIARRGSTLSSTSGTWSGTNSVFTLQWQRSADGTTWTNIAGATGALYTLGAADEGDTVRLLVTATNPDGTASAPSGATATVAASPPVNTAVPVITGAAQRTTTLTASSGSWSGVGNVLAYQWQRSANGSAWTPITGATTAAYTLATADEGDYVRVLVTATNPDGSVAQGSAPTTLVQGMPPVNTRAPAVVGTPSVGAVLSVDTGTWAPLGPSFSYVWQRGDATDGYTNIPGATSATYTTVAGDVGQNIRVIVTATNPDGSAGATSAATPAVAEPPVNLVVPAAPSGPAVNGSTLTADPGSWNSPSTYVYTWLRCPSTATQVTSACASVTTGASYMLSNADIGFEMAVAVTATSVGGSTTADSALTAVIAGQPLTNTAPPSISGNPQAPNTVYANPGTWSVALTSATYQWNRCDADGVSNCRLIAADTSHYTLSAADDGHTLVLVADVTSPGRAAVAQSPPLTIQDQPLPQATVLPVVSGTAIRTFVLGATGGTWTNSPTSLSYQWQRCNASGLACQAISGATQPTYELGVADEGSTITVAVTGTNTSGSTTAVAHHSGVVGQLLPVNTHAPAFSFLGIQQGAPVSVGGATWRTTSETTYSTVWQRCNTVGSACQPIPGATTSTYTPTAIDVGHTLVVVVTATNADGSVISSTAPSDVVLPAAPRWRALPVLSASSASVGGALTITPGAWSGPAVSTDTTEIVRCTSACVSVATGRSYTIASGDVGAILRVRETASNAGGSTVIWSSQYVGPIASALSASAVLADGQVVLRNNAGTELAVARLATTTSFSADALIAGAARHTGRVVREVTVRRARKVRGTLRAWVCPVGVGRGAAPLPCTRQVTLRATARLRLPATMTGKIRVVVVRRRH
ncbi:MAG: hypothetical protein WBQ18_20550 [Solirubrobacteraceae bacterium]